MLNTAYKPKFFVKKKPTKTVDLSQKLKSRQKYRKNKFKLKLYNKRWRQRNRLQLKRKRLLKKMRKSW